MPDTLKNPTATEPVQAEPDLLPCPWCGTAENVRVDMGYYYGEVACLNCNGAISCGPEKTTRAEAITAWNTRPTSDLAERIEGLNLPTIIHGALSRIDVMNYLNMPAGTADDVAEAILAALKEENNHGQ